MKILENFSLINPLVKYALKKYSNKYEDYKLKSVLKSKLYQKGYTIEEINKVVE
mgnify:CR=1 FL=1